MDSGTFLENFATIAQAPGGVQRLRDLVLDLSVRGRLVDQDVSEGDGRHVIEAAGETIADAVAKGWGRRRDLPDPAPEEFPFDVPETWAWARLPTVSHGLGQLTPKSNFTYIDVSSVNGEDGSLKGEPSVVTPDEAPSRARKAVERDVVLYSTIRPYLRNVVHVDREFDPPAIASTAFAVLRPVPGLDPRFLKVCLRSAYFSKFVESRQKGVAYPAINDGDLAFGLLPIPPFEEQRRIVARVDELMRLCDELEARQERRCHVTRRLRGSALHALTEAETQEDLRKAWARVDTCWPQLTDDPDAPSALRATVLQLAIEGRLAAQDPSDGGTAELLERIRSEKSAHSATNRGRQTDLLPPIGSPLLRIPDSWLWAPLGDLALEMRYGSSAKSDATGDVPVLRMGNLQGGVIDWSDLKYTTDPLEIARYTLPSRAVLFNRTNSPELVGKTAIYRGERPAVFAGYLIHIREASGLDAEFLNLVLNSTFARSWCASAKTDGISQSNISASKLARFPFPCPPLLEQRRIVERTKDLLEMCGELEASLAARETRVDALVELRLISCDARVS